MSEERTLFKNISFLSLSMFLPNILNLIFLMIVARILLKSSMNDYATIISYVSMFVLLSDIGTAGILIRDVARDRSKMESYFGTFFCTRFTITIVMVVLAVALVGFMPYPPQITSLIYVYAFSQLLFQVAQIFSSLFQAYEKMEYIAYGTIIQSVVYFVFGLIFINKDLFHLDVAGLIYANLLASAIMLAFYMLAVHKRITRIRISFDPHLFKYLALAGIPFGVAGILNIIYSYVDRFLISIMRYDDIANYTFPYTLVMSLTFILLAYTSSVFPLFSKIFGKGGNSIRYACEKSFKYLFTLMLPICVGTTLLADRIIYTIYGPNFGGAIPVLQVLIWLLLFMVITNIGFPLLTATHRERLNMYIMAVTAVLNIALNILLIPSYGAVGSSVASLLTLGVMNAALTLYAIRDDLSGANILKPIMKVIGASAVMAVFIVLVPMNNLLLYVAAGGIVYFAALLMIGGISEDDVDIAGKIIFGNKAGSSAILSMVKRLVARH